MKRKLLEVLCCPVCRGELSAAGETTSASGEILTGTLTCWSCRAAFPIRDGVPQMIPNAGAVRVTKRSFQYQWLQRFRGVAEPRMLIFGQDVHESVRWLGDCARGAFAPPGRGHWCLDAGCGSAEKTRAFAKAWPQHQVVGIDLSDSLLLSAAEARDVENLHFVQADIMAPPFRRHTFRVAMSIAVLHHTPDTRRAFEAIARTVMPGGRFITWIYPQADEYPASPYGLLYRQRDVHFLNLAHRLPPTLGMLWCRAYVALLFFPVLLPLLRRLQPFAGLAERYRLSRADIYHSAVFFAFDNVMPEYQHRHRKEEVISWYRDCDYDRVTAEFPAVFVGVAGEGQATRRPA